MPALADIDRRLTALLSDFDNQVKSLSFRVICELTDRHRIASLTYPGVYKIDIKVTGRHKTVDSWINWFTPLWHDKRYKKRFVPNLKPGRIRKHKKLPEWMPLYIGKARLINKRVVEHLDLPLNKRTFALKLRARSNLSQQVFRVSTIRLRTTNYDVFAPRLESAKRDQFHPITGRQ